MRNKKVYIEGYGDHYVTMWQRWGWEIANAPGLADVIQFTGGEDVNPELYGEATHPDTFYNERRDQVCIDLFNYARDNGIPMVGICRGGQILNVLNGGKMFQHCDGHAIFGTHKARILESGLEVDVTSTHHQIMRPNREKGIVLMEADKLGTFKEHMYLLDQEGVGRFDWNIENLQHEDDVEAIYYPDTNSLAFQPHPEYCEEKSGCVQAYKSFLRNYVGLDV
jgi:gamma-glutamyl-gamma-aminobutyrate hydrolase PuuD